MYMICITHPNRSDDGEMFIVKDQATLSSKYIPQYFGHSNFSSFDRQLNFYGFRKNYPNSLRHPSNMGATDNLKHVWFYHEYFKRGRPDLFHLIKRASSKKSSSKKNNNAKRKRSEVEELRDEVAALESRLSTVSSSIESKFAQLSREIEEKIAAMRAIVCEASSRISMRQASGFDQSSQGAGSSNCGFSASEVETSYTARLGSFDATQTPIPAEDLSLAGPLNIKPLTGKIGRMTTEDIIMAIDPSLLKPPSSKVGRMTTMEEIIALDDSILPLSLKQPPTAKFSRETTDEVINSMNYISASMDRPEKLHRSREVRSSTADEAMMLVDRRPNLKMTRTSTEEITESLPLNFNRPSKGIGRMTTEEFFGEWLDESPANAGDKMTFKRTAVNESNVQGHEAATLLMLASQNVPLQHK